MLGYSSASVRLAWGLLAVWFVQALSGLWLPHLYRDAGWITATWYGNDWVTLALACPLLFAALSGGRLDLPRWQVVRVGLVGYSVYNYAFYLFGAALNLWFPLYVVAFVGSIAALVATLATVHIDDAGRLFGPRTPRRALGGYMMAVGVGLSTVWIVMWARHVFAGAALPAEPEVFRLVAALDLAFMLPALTAGGWLFWRRRPWGVAIASIALVQATLYLCVLSVSSVVLVRRDLAPSPGEVVVWAPLAAVTGVMTLLLVASVRSSVPGLAHGPSAGEPSSRPAHLSSTIA